MKTLLEAFRRKLERDRSILPEQTTLAAANREIELLGDTTNAPLAKTIMGALGSAGLIIAPPSLPFLELLPQRYCPVPATLKPRDSETRLFLHEIPVLPNDAPIDTIIGLLKARKGVLVEKIGIIAAGVFTLEQAYINFSSIFHALFIAYLVDLLQRGPLLPQEPVLFSEFRTRWLRPVNKSDFIFAPSIDNTETLRSEMIATGRYTVESGLVDSFFGNISALQDGVLHISQTAASLDELAGQIDPVPLDLSSTAGITASSELAAHRAVVDATGARTVLHAHPRFSVVASLLCERTDCKGEDCWRSCPHERSILGVPVISGETGAGGLATTLPRAMQTSPLALVYGHGTFATGSTGFSEPFQAMAEFENLCREHYLNSLDERWPAMAAGD